MAETTKYDQTFWRKEADRFFPQGCQCADDSGTCDWCRVYYGYDKPWIDEEGRDLTSTIPPRRSLAKGQP